MSIVLDGSNGITTPTYGGADTSEYLVPVTQFKNRLINSDMRIDQRNAGASVTVTTTTGYTLDRWTAAVSQSSKFSVQQNAGSVTPPSGFSNYLGVTSLSAYSVGSTDYFNIYQPIEGFNTADLAWGTADAKTVTLSFWVRSSLTGTFGGVLQNNSGGRFYPFSYTISAANTWEYKSITVAGDTSGTWPTNNTASIQVRFGLGVGSTYSGTAGSWSGTTYASTTGAVSVVGTNGATWFLTGVQLEVGSTATSFDYRPYGTELALCQRYLPATTPQAATGYLGMAYEYSTTNASASIPFQVTPRVPPTGIIATAASGFDIADNAARTATSILFQGGTYTMGTVQVDSTGFTVGFAAGFRTKSSTSQILFTGCEL